jgi:polyhydroxyalkanoate synthase
VKSTQSSESPGRAVLDKLGVAEDPLVGSDPVAFLRALGAAGAALVKKPTGTAAASARLLLGSAAAVRAAAGRAVGLHPAGPTSHEDGDKRFRDPAYEENPLYFLLEQQFLLGSKLVTELLDAAELEASKDAKARFAAQFVLDALAPTNTFLGNPAALHEAFETGGKSIARGAKNMLSDIRHNGGWPSQVDDSDFEVRVNLAATPGSVVYAIN